MPAQTTGEYAMWAERVKNPKRAEMILALLQTELRKSGNENLSATEVAEKLIDKAHHTLNQQQIPLTFPQTEIAQDLSIQLGKDATDISLADLAKHRSDLKKSMEVIASTAGKSSAPYQNTQKKLSEIYQAIDEKTLSEVSRALDFGTALETHAKKMDENLQNTKYHILQETKKDAQKNDILACSMPDKSVLTDAINALPDTEKKDTNSVLNSLNIKINDIENDIAALHDKASKTNNPTQLEALKTEAHNILRKLGDVGDMLTDDSTRKLIEAKFQDQKKHGDLREYVEQLLALQTTLINNIAGPQKTSFTPIRYSSEAFDTTEQDRLFTASKMGGAITGISYKKWVKDDPSDQYSKVGDSRAGKWVDVKDELYDSHGKKIDLTGLTPEILYEAKILTEKEIKNKGDKNYHIEVSENKTSITFHTGNSANRQIFFDKIGEVMTARKTAKSEVQYGAQQPEPAQKPASAAQVDYAARPDTPGAASTGVATATGAQTGAQPSAKPGAEPNSTPTTSRGS